MAEVGRFTNLAGLGFLFALGAACSGTRTAVPVDDLPGTGPMQIRPGVVEVVRGKTQRFQALIDGRVTPGVSWAVPGEGGGKVDESGLYVAPDALGTYYVVATLASDPSKSAAARVDVVQASNTEATGLLPADRITRWVPGLDAVGGIPSDDDATRPATIHLPAGNPYRGYSVDPRLGDGTSDATAVIQAALDEAGAQATETSRRVVFLEEGTYSIRDPGLIVPSFVTLRGRGPRGPTATRLVKGRDSNMPVVQIGELWVKHTTPVDLADDAAHGATQITVSSNPGYRVGELVFIDQVVDTARIGSWWNPLRQGPGEDSRSWFSRMNRPTGQVVEIASISGSTLRLSAPLRLPYYVSNQAQVVRFSGDTQDGPASATRKWMGLEDIYVSGGGGGQGNVPFSAASYSWAKNIESEGSEGSSVAFLSTFRCVLRDSFVHSTSNPNPGGGGYGIDVSYYAADNLMENNISWNFNKVITMRASGGGNVIGYNYFEDGWGAGYPTIPEVGLNASHYATPHHELFEGNQVWNIGGDAFWGNSIHNTFFRNHATGRRRSVPPLRLTDEVGRRFIDVPEWHLYYSFIGNVLGSSTMTAAPQSGFIYEDAPPWRFNPAPMWAIGVQHDAGTEGQDAQVVATTIRHGNYDFVSMSTVWDPTIERKDLPPSLYLESKPSFFGERSWPWVAPEVNGGALGALPARERFDQLMFP